MVAPRGLRILPLLLGAAEEAAGGGLCQCPGWALNTKDTGWTSSDPSNPGLHVRAQSVPECQQLCCDQNEDGACEAFTFDGQAKAPSRRCTLWSTPPETTTHQAGWTSGTISLGYRCPLAAGADLVAWAFVIGLCGALTVYCVIGIVYRRLAAAPRVGAHSGLLAPMPTQQQEEWLPHHAFWVGLGGLVIDGIAFAMGARTQRTDPALPAGVVPRPAAASPPRNPSAVK